MAGTTRRGIGSGAAVLAVARRSPMSTVPEGASDAENRTSIVAALRRQDDAPPEGGMRELPLAEVAPHPDNPRGALGDLSELADSIAAFDVLQPVVVVPAEPYLQAHPQHRDAVGDRKWVLYAGHRRRAASELAGKATIPAMIRPDLVGEGMAAIAFVVENVHRSDLAPLEEARAYALLADLGVAQREIAKRTGVSQSHVSKRLALLRLPQQAQDDLAAATLTVADALALAQAPAADQAEVYALARERHWPISSAISEVARVTQETKARAKGERQAKAEGVDLVDPHARWGEAAHLHALYTEAEVTSAREQGTLLAAPTGNGLTYYSTDPTRTPTLASGERDGDEQERRRATKARVEACAQLVQTAPSVQQRADDLARTIFRGHVTFADSLKRVHKWLGEKVGEKTSDAYAWHRSLEQEPSEVQHWVAWAMAVASDEGHANDYNRSHWEAADAVHLQRLIAGVGYEPTPFEQRRLAAALAASGSSARIEPATDPEEQP